MTKNNIKSNANCNQIILDHFWHISDASEERRCRSVQIILQNLSKQVINKQYNDLSYCLDRLVRGLISTRKFARHGFCLLLTELLIHFPEQIDVKQMIQISEKEYGQFKEDIDSELTIAWTLFISCLLKSERITIDLDEDVLSKLFDILFVIGCKKNYVEIIVCQLMNNFYEIFQKNIKIFEKIIIEQMMNMDDRGNKLFKTYLILLAHQKYSTTSCEEFILNNVYKNQSKDYINIIKLIKETTKYQPNIHPINELLVETMRKIDSQNLDLFFSKLIEDVFKVDITKASLGFEIIPILLKHSKHTQIKIILSPNVIRLIIQALSNKKHPLHNAALILSDHLQNYSLQNKDKTRLQIELAKCFVEKPGSINFDELSRSKLLFNILKHFNNNSIKEWIDVLLGLAINQDNIIATDFYRVKCLQQMTHLLKIYNGDLEFLKMNCKFLLAYSYFNVDRFPKSLLFFNQLNDTSKEIKRFKYPVSEKLRQQFIISFRNVLSHLYSLASIQVQADFSSSNQKLKNQIKVYMEIKDAIIDLVGNKNLEMSVDKNLSSKKLKETIFEINEKLDSIADRDDNKSNVFQLLYLHFMMESFENLYDIQNILPDFNECVDRALATEQKKHQHKSDEPIWSDVLVELLISLITKSKSIKNIILVTFKHLVPFITVVGIQSLNEAFLNDETIEFVDTEDEDIESDGDENMENEEHTENSDDSTSEDDDEDKDELISDDSEVVHEQFKNDIVKALGPAADKDGDDRDSDQCLSDTEMFKLDDSLAEVFRKKFGKKKRQIESGNLLKSFKLRVLDLIRILIDYSTELSIGTIFLILSSVLKFLRSNYSSKNMLPVSNKCIQIITQISKSHPILIGNEQISEDDFEKLLNTLSELQCKCATPNLQQVLISLTSWLFSLAQKHLPKSDLKFLHRHTERILKDLFERSNNETHPQLLKIIIPLLIKFENPKKSFFDSPYFNLLHHYSTDKNIRIFKRCVALDLLSSILNLIEKNNEQQQLQSLKLSEQFLGQLLEIMKSEPSSKEVNLINSIIKLLISLNVFRLKSDSLENFKTDILKIINVLPKELRKKINKLFIHKLKNIESI